jgi:hypothetical protein
MCGAMTGSRHPRPRPRRARGERPATGEKRRGCALSAQAMRVVSAPFTGQATRARRRVNERALSPQVAAQAGNVCPPRGRRCCPNRREEDACVRCRCRPSAKRLDRSLVGRAHESSAGSGFLRAALLAPWTPSGHPGGRSSSPPVPDSRRRGERVASSPSPSATHRPASQAPRPRARNTGTRGRGDPSNLVGRRGNCATGQPTPTPTPPPQASESREPGGPLGPDLGRDGV